jgi:hypothetical protein
VACPLGEVGVGGWDALQARVVRLRPAVGPGARVVWWLGGWVVGWLGGWVVGWLGGWVVGLWHLASCLRLLGRGGHWPGPCQDLVGPRTSFKLPGLHFKLPGCLDPAPCLDLTLGLMDGEGNLKVQAR